MYLVAAYCAGAYLQVTAPSSLSYSSLNISATKGVEYTEAAPTYNGDTASFTISPALASGLSIDPNTGIISGTPTVLSVVNVSHTVTATNAGGSTTLVRQVRVRDVAPSNLVYPLTSQTYIPGQAITANIPSISGGPVTAWSISPSLPGGLGLRQSDGAIFGTPTQSISQTVFTVTAQNSGGSTTGQVTITVQQAAPSSLTYAPNNFSFTKLSAITALTPLYNGTVTSWSVSPSLPTGLGIDAATGVISGTPINVTGSAVYTVTASNASGSTTRNITIVVNDMAPQIMSYTRQSPTYSVGTPINLNSPIISGGAVTSWTISPQLPAGLAFNTASGIMSGTPTVEAALNYYTITAINSGGSANINLSITVAPANPIFSKPEVHVSGERTELQISRPTLSTITKVQQNPIFSEQSNWAKVHAVWKNINVAPGNTNRIQGATFSGTSDMLAAFKGAAPDGSTYELQRIWLARANGQKLRINRNDIDTPTALDIEVSDA